MRTYFHVFLKLQKEAFTLPSLEINHHWTFRAYNCLTKQVQKIPLIFLIFFPKLLATFKKLCFRIPVNDDFWNCKTLYRYNSCARYLRIPCLNVLYLTCTNSHNFLNFDFGCFANANFYKLLNQEFFVNTKFCGCKILSFFSDTKFFWNKLKQHHYVVLTDLDVVAFRTSHLTLLFRQIDYLTFVCT